MLAKPFQTKLDLKNNQKSAELASNSVPKRSHRMKIPKIGNKEIPLHNFGINLAHLPLSKQHTYLSKVWAIHKKQDSAQQQRPKSLYNRPVQLLKQYLQRKQKLLYHPLITANPETNFQYQTNSKQFVRTANDFRIKKTNKKLLAVEPGNSVQYEVEQTKYYPDRTEMDFVNLNIGKNIYQMTHEQLEQSIRWKKQFLESLTQKVRQSKTSSFTQRVRS